MIGFERHPESFDFLRRRVLGSITRKADLQKASSLLKMPDALRRRKKITNAA